MFARFFRRRKNPPPVFSVGRALKPSPGLKVRRYDDADFDACMRLYTLNEPGRFPPDTAPVYAAFLRRAEDLILVLEQDGEIVGTGGIGLRSDAGRLYGWLCFGLLAPTHQGKGLGTALLLARMALLPADRLPIPVLLMAVQGSRSFYEQFGFRLFCWDVGQSLVAGFLIAEATPEAVEKSRACLHASGIKISDEDASIPVVARPKAEPFSPPTIEQAGVRWVRGPMRQTLFCRWRPEDELR